MLVALLRWLQALDSPSQLSAGSPASAYAPFPLLRVLLPL